MAQINNRMILAAIVAAKGSKGRNQIAEDLNVTPANVTSVRNDAVKQIDELRKMDQAHVMQGTGLTVGQILEKTLARYGGEDLPFLQMKDTRGRAKKSTLEKLGFSLEDLEV